MSDTDFSDFFMNDHAPESAPEPERKPATKGESKAPASFLLDAGLPASIDAERTILGAILLDNQALVECEERLIAEDFSLDSHRRIYVRMSGLHNDGRAVDLVTLANELQRTKEIEAIGGVAYLASLTEGLPRRPVINEYIRIVKDKSVGRQLMTVASAAIARAADQSEPQIKVGMDLVTQAQNIVTEGMASTLERAGDFLSVEFPTPKAMADDATRLRGIDTGFAELDEMLCGMQRGELAIVAARPSMGKTAWLFNVAEHVCLNNDLTGALFSFEMSKESLLRRGICSRARVPLQMHRGGTMTSGMIDQFQEAYAEIHNSNLWIDDVPKTAPKIAAECRALKARQGLHWIGIDYLGLFRHDEGKRNFNQVAETGLDVLLMKYMAKELGVPVVLLCQLNRDNTKREDKRPTLSDLRGAGAIEEHADLVAFVHRPGYYDLKDESLKHKAELILAKQRNGPTGIVQMHWEPSYTRFSDPIDPKDFQSDFSYWQGR